DGLPVAWRDFQIATRLRPASWSLAAKAAAVSQAVSPGMAVHFWSVAIEHAGPRAETVLDSAWRNTSGTTNAEPFWSGFIETHPRLFLAFALGVGEEKIAREWFDRWWKSRAFTAALD